MAIDPRQSQRNLDNLFKALPDKVKKVYLRKSLRQGAKIVQTEAKATAPVHLGLMRRMIRILPGRTKGGTVSILVGISKKWFTGKAFYAAFVVFGHFTGRRLRLNTKGPEARETYRQKSLEAGRRFVQGNPFLDEALASRETEVVDTIGASLKQQIEAGWPRP
jgi:HK97 gp10 family phage protein